jgi:hypothetical protein
MDKKTREGISKEAFPKGKVQGVSQMDELIRLLRRLNDKIDRIEITLSEIGLNKIVLDEQKVFAKEGELEGKTYASTIDGGLIKQTRIPVCDFCGAKSEEFDACISCGKKLCNNCKILFENRIYCIDCLEEILPLTKQEYKVLVAIANKLRSLDEIAIVTKIKKDLIRECKKNLEKNGLISSKGFLFFKETDVLDKGLEAIAAYRQVYGSEEDVALFEEELMRLLNEKN